MLGLLVIRDDRVLAVARAVSRPANNDRPFSGGRRGYWPHADDLRSTRLHRVRRRSESPCRSAAKLPAGTGFLPARSFGPVFTTTSPDHGDEAIVRWKLRTVVWYYASRFLQHDVQPDLSVRQRAPRLGTVALVHLMSAGIQS